MTGKRRMVLGMLLPWVCPVIAATVGPAEIAGNGTVSVDGMSFHYMHWTPKWQPASSARAEVVRHSGDGRCTETGWVFRTARREPLQVRQRVKLLAPYTVELSGEITSKPPVPGRVMLTLALESRQFAARLILVDGGKIRLPADPNPAHRQLVDLRPFRKIELTRPDGGGNLLIESDGLRFDCWDGRPQGFFRLRFEMPGEAEKKVTLRITDRSGGSRPLVMDSVMNRAFRDDRPGDGKGGWSDQGPQQDLRMIPLGAQRFGGVNFRIVDPEKNGGNSCLVLHHGRPLRAVLSPVRGQGDYLSLLHALAWAGQGEERIGDVILRYADGTEQVQSMRNRIDVGDWWNSHHLRNGRQAWSSLCHGRRVGLFRTTWKIENKPIREIEFRSASAQRCWMIVAASFGDRMPAPGYDEPPLEFHENADWKPFAFDKEVEPGSALDFSFLLDAPAGKYGHVTASGENFSFERAPERTIRFLGTNFCWGTVAPERSVAEQVARRLAAYGYNAVRFHHFDSMLFGGADGTEMQPQMLDRMDYFIYCLKQQGIYVTLDLHTTRKLTAAQLKSVPEGATGYGTLKLLLALRHPETYGNFRKLVRNFLNHRNPYTGLAWKEEPAIATINLINEGNLAYWINVSNSRTGRELYRKRYREFCAGQKLEGVEEFVRKRRFEIAMERELFADLKKLVRDELKCRILLCNMNMHVAPHLAEIRQDYDYVDVHSYFNPPHGPLPHRFITASSITMPDALPPTAVSRARLAGKPLTCTEYNWAFPDLFRAHSGVLMGAYCALQNINGIWRFDYACPTADLTRDAMLHTFETNSDPMALFSDRIAALMLLRGDVAAAPGVVKVRTGSFTCRLPEAKEPGNPEELQLGLLSLITRVALTGDREAELCFSGDPEEKGKIRLDDRECFRKLKLRGLLGDGFRSADGTLFRSATGELELDSRHGVFRAVTPRTEVLTGQKDGRLSGRNLSAEIAGGSAVVAAASLDGAPLNQSGRIVLFHLTNALNTGTAFNNDRMDRHVSRGGLPKLIRSGTAEVVLRHDPGEAEVFALSFSGKRLRRVESDGAPAGALRFRASVLGGKAPVAAYEIVYRR